MWQPSFPAYNPHSMVCLSIAPGATSSAEPNNRGYVLMQLLITPGGVVRCIYSEEIDLHALGRTIITRGSHVEPDDFGRWQADLSPVGGPNLGPFLCRSQALAAERTWLEEHWLR